MNALDIPETDLREPLDTGIWVEPRDNDPASEDDRQKKVVNRFKRDFPHVAIHAVPNGGRQSDWARIRGERMGVVAGQPDLGFDWFGGSAVVEMKNGKEMPRQNQVDRLNRLYRMGKGVAVCRTVDGVIYALRMLGAPLGDRMGL